MSTGLFSHRPNPEQLYARSKSKGSSVAPLLKHKRCLTEANKDDLIKDHDVRHILEKKQQAGQPITAELNHLERRTQQGDIASGQLFWRLQMQDDKLVQALRGMTATATLGDKVATRALENMFFLGNKLINANQQLTIHGRRVISHLASYSQQGHQTGLDILQGLIQVAEPKVARAMIREYRTVSNNFQQARELTEQVEARQASTAAPAQLVASC